MFINFNSEQRFHIEFLYRDSKQFTGLCNCQSRDAKAMDFAFNMSLSTINVARQFRKDFYSTAFEPLFNFYKNYRTIVERV